MSEIQPAQFADATGRVHTLRVTTWTCKRVRDELGVQLSEIYTGSLATRLAAEPELLGDLLYLVAGVDDQPEAFATAVAPVLDHATTALMEALSDFFDRLTNGAAGRVVRASRETMARANQIASDRAKAADRLDLERIIDEVLNRLEPNQVIDEALQRTSSGGSSTSGPASAASTPDPSPSGS